jgi:hypothetical protein
MELLDEEDEELLPLELLLELDVLLESLEDSSLLSSLLSVEDPDEEQDDDDDDYVAEDLALFTVYTRLCPM